MSMKRRSIVQAFAGLALVCAFAFPTLAQTDPNPQPKEKPPAARVRTVTSPGRTSGPLVIDLVIAYRGKKAYSGEVILKLTRSGNAEAELRTPGIVFTEGQSTFRYTIPHVNRLHEPDSTRVAVTMVTKEHGTLNLGVHTILAGKSDERSLVMGVVDPWERSAGRTSKLISSLNFVKFRPDGNKRGLTANPARLDPATVPYDPISLCAYDVVVIPGDGLSALEDDQLNAVRAWVRAGGAAAVSLGANLNAKHAKFLNDTIAGDGTGHRFVAQPGGTLGIEPEPPATNVGVYDAGFGRLIVATDATDEGLFDSPAWTHAAIHLWRFRASQRGLLRSGKGWDLKQERPTQQFDQWGNEIYDGEVDVVRPIDQFRYYPLTLPAGGNLEPLLMPTSVRVVPFILVVMILSLFALAVGPGDWLVLGLIRQHKLTWIVFPVIAVAFTVATVYIAEYYMGSRSYERAVVVEDVDATGTVLKRSRLQLTFSAVQKRIRHELDGALLTPMAPSSFAHSQVTYDYTGATVAAGASEEAASAMVEIDGRYPTRYGSNQRVKQWSPRMDRFTQIAPAEGDPPTHIQWGRITTELMKAGRAAEILPDNFRGTLAVYHQSDKPRVMYGGMNPGQIGYLSKQGDVSGFVSNLCVRPREGFFTLVSQVSPTGSDNLEDLSVFDQDDRSQWLIVVLEAKGDDLMMYRYLHREPGDRR